MVQNNENNDYDLPPHPSTSSSFECMHLVKSELPQGELKYTYKDVHSRSESVDGTNDFEGHTRVSSHVVSPRERRKGGFSSLFMPDRNKVRKGTENKRAHSYRGHESFSNQKRVSRSQSIDSIQHLNRTPPPLPRNGSNKRYNLMFNGRRSNNRKSFTGSLNSLLDGQSRASQRRIIQEGDTRNQRVSRRSPHQSPRRIHRTRSNSRDRSIATSLDSLFMVNSSNHVSPKNNRSRRGEFLDKNRFDFGQSQRNRTRNRSESRTPPLLPRKGSLKKVHKENGHSIHGSRSSRTAQKEHMRNGSVHFEDTTI